MSVSGGFLPSLGEGTVSEEKKLRLVKKKKPILMFSLLAPKPFLLRFKRLYEHKIVEIAQSSPAVLGAKSSEIYLFDSIQTYSLLELAGGGGGVTRLSLTNQVKGLDTNVDLKSLYLLPKMPNIRKTFLDLNGLQQLLLILYNIIF